MNLDIEKLSKRELAELISIANLIKNEYPTGIVSVVSDTFDFWAVMEKLLPILKPVIESRKPNSLGLCKVVFRPDSGNPVDVICGKEPVFYKGIPNIPKIVQKGAIEALWDVFGGTTNAKGYKELNPRVGLIYGDSITLERQQQILEKLMIKNFASTNIVLGIGSYTYQYNTRDTFGFAMKATFAVINDNPINIQKDPATDDGTKKSAQGLLQVTLIDDKLTLKDNCSWEEEKDSLLKSVFLNGKLEITTFQQITDRLWKH